VRRVRLRTGRAALTGAMTAAALLLFLPMRAGLGWTGLAEEGLTARRVTGTVWGGRLTEARFGDLVLGDLDAGVAPLPLLIGQARVRLSGGQGLRGAAVVSRHLLGVESMSAALPTGRVFAPLPVTRLELFDATVRFRDGGCEEAGGRVRVALGGDLGGVTLPPALSGTLRCEGNALLASVAGSAGTESATLRVTADGRYRATLSVRPTDPLAGPKLEQAGFAAGGDGYVLAVDGRF